MKTLFLFALISTSSHLSSLSQTVITKKHKIVSLDTNRIWTIQTNSFLLASIFDYERFLKKRKYNSYTLFLLDSVKTVKKINDTLEFAASIVQHFKDEITGEIYSNAQREKQVNRGNHKGERVLQDTTFRFAVADIRHLKVQTRERNSRRIDGLSVVGIFFCGAGITVYSIVTLIQGNPNGNGFYALAAGAALMGISKYLVNRYKWIHDFKITKNKWSIK